MVPTPVCESSSGVEVSVCASDRSHSKKLAIQARSVVSGGPCNVRRGCRYVDEETSSLRTVRRLAESVQQRHSAILTGPAGSGKTYVIRQLNTVLAAQYSRVAFIVGTNAGSQVPLGAFAGVQGIPEVPLHSPATVVDAFARHRSETVVIVDNVDLLDDASLYVVTQLITTTQMPTILTVRDLGVAPQSVRDLYDSGDLAEFPLAPLAEPEAVCLLRDLVGGELTPRAQAQILAAGEGNPMRLREIVRGSQDDARLVQTPHGWDLIGPPSPTQRLAGLMAERFRHLTDSAMEAATLVALVGECPISALNEADRHALAQAHIIDVTECGWVESTLDVVVAVKE
ncbi:hypothetical protein CEP80_05155 [Jonesia denitrificans]|nr:hypothetical protein CEP80_05155 [Jonesia denitrificans]